MSFEKSPLAFAIRSDFVVSGVVKEAARCWAAEWVDEEVKLQT